MTRKFRVDQRSHQRLYVKDQIPLAIARRESFRYGRLNGRYGCEGFGDQVGKLPEQYHEQFEQACADPYTYAVWYDDTPIAWRTFMDGWTVPDLGRFARKHRETVGQVIADENDIDRHELVG